MDSDTVLKVGQVSCRHLQAGIWGFSHDMNQKFQEKLVSTKCVQVYSTRIAIVDAKNYSFEHSE